MRSLRLIMKRMDAIKRIGIFRRIAYEWKWSIDNHDNHGIRKKSGREFCLFLAQKA
ncbi:MAG: hypothetical protein QXO75_07595 [Nitrososphaerota archaeon]